MAEKDFHISEKYNFRHALTALLFFLQEDIVYLGTENRVTARPSPSPADGIKTPILHHGA
jgi:hypothetical protein